MENIQEYLEKMCDEKTLEKRRANAVIPVCLGLAGTVVLLYGILAELSDTISNALIIIGFMVAFLGFAMVFRLFDKKSGHYLYVKTHSRLRTHSVYVAASDKELCRQIVETKDFARLADVHKNNSTLTMLNATISDDNRFAVIQLYEYDLSFVPASECAVACNNEAGYIRAFIDKPVS